MAWKNWGKRELVSLAIAGHVTACPAWNKAKTVFLYLGGENEINTAYIKERAGEKTLCAPVSMGAGIMEIREFRGYDDLIPDAHGIPAPSQEAPKIKKIELAIVPALAYDKKGFRLGQGGGYYDRFLADFSGVSIGLCPGCFFLDCVPTQPHDIPVNYVITENGLYNTL